MTIEHLSSAQARIVALQDGLRIEADVNINSLGRADGIGNGHVARTDADGAAGEPLADFSSYTGSRHRTMYGEPTLEQQIELLTIIDTFCADIRSRTYTLTATSAAVDE